MHRLGRSLLAVVMAMLWLIPGAFAQGAPALSIVSPTAGQKITSTDIPVQVSVSNFTIDCLQAGLPAKAGVGHIHVMLDGMSMASLTNFYCSDKFTISGQGVKAGQHMLTIDFASNLHEDIMSTAKEVKFDYEPTTAPAALPAPTNAGTPTVAVTSPTDGATVGPQFTIQTTIANFTPSCDLEGKQDVAGHGHIHIYVDGMMSGGMMSMAGMIGMPCSNTIPVNLADWSSGKHTVTVALVQDDHTPIMGVKDAMFTVNLNNPAMPAAAAAAAMPAALPKTGGNPYTLPGALLISALLIGAGAGMRRFRRPSRE